MKQGRRRDSHGGDWDLGPQTQGVGRRVETPTHHIQQTRSLPITVSCVALEKRLPLSDPQLPTCQMGLVI